MFRDMDARVGGENLRDLKQRLKEGEDKIRIFTPKMMRKVKFQAKNGYKIYFLSQKLQKINFYGQNLAEN